VRSPGASSSCKSERATAARCGVVAALARFQS